MGNEERDNAGDRREAGKGGREGSERSLGFGMDGA